MTLCLKETIGGVVVFYQELRDQKLWHIHVPNELFFEALFDSQLDVDFYNLTYDNEKDCYADFCAILLELARKRMLNLQEMCKLGSLMEELSIDTKEIDSLIDEMANEVKELEERFSWDNLSEREKQILDAFLDLQKKSGEGERLRSLYRKDKEPDERVWEF